VLFRSPRPTYKQGREAPQWYAELVLPPLQRQVIELPGGRLTVEAEPSRAILDGWDELMRLAAVGGVALLSLLVGIYALVGRALRPWPRLVAGLGRLQAGDYHARLPVLPGLEAGLIGREVNRLAEAIEEQLDARMRAFEAERRLQESRELARRLEVHTDEERRAIARLLHDEFAQSVTGMRSLARGLQDRLAALDPASAQAARLISDEAARLYDAMQGLIPRLAPPALEELGLADALQALVDRSRGLHPQVQLDWMMSDEAGPGRHRLAPEGARALYALGQEGLTNALRHSGASRIELRLGVESDFEGGAGTALCLRVSDDGMGLQPQSPEREHHGLRGLRERLEGLGGRLELGPGLAGRGLGVTGMLPLATVSALSDVSAVLPVAAFVAADNAAMDMKNMTERRP
jgi:two-component system sensor histidine kinase UhpB